MFSAEAHVEAAIKELRSDRDTLDRQIKVLEGTLAALRGESQPQEAAPPVRVRVAGAPASVREVAMRLAEERESFTLADLVEALRQVGNDSAYASVSSMMSRLVRDGDLARVVGQRGTFRLPGKITEGPAATAGPSVGTNGSAVAAAAPDQQHGGGDAYDGGAGRDQGGQDPDHGSHRGPPVEGPVPVPTS